MSIEKTFEILGDDAGSFIPQDLERSGTCRFKDMDEKSTFEIINEPTNQ